MPRLQAQAWQVYRRFCFRVSMVVLIRINGIFWGLREWRLRRQRRMPWTSKAFFRIESSNESTWYPMVNAQKCCEDISPETVVWTHCVCLDRNKHNENMLLRSARPWVWIRNIGFKEVWPVGKATCILHLVILQIVSHVYFYFRSNQSPCDVDASVETSPHFGGGWGGTGQGGSRPPVRASGRGSRLVAP